VTVKGEAFPANWTEFNQQRSDDTRHSVAVKPGQLTEVCGVVVRDTLPSKLLHRFRPECDEESPKVGTFEDLSNLMSCLGHDESLVLDRSNDN
jgi:hypothetical protein